MKKVLLLPFCSKNDFIDRLEDFTYEYSLNNLDRSFPLDEVFKDKDFLFLGEIRNDQAEVYSPFIESLQFKNKFKEFYDEYKALTKKLEGFRSLQVLGRIGRGSIGVINSDNFFYLDEDPNLFYYKIKMEEFGNDLSLIIQRRKFHFLTDGIFPNGLIPVFLILSFAIILIIVLHKSILDWHERLFVLIIFLICISKSALLFFQLPKIYELILKRRKIVEEYFLFLLQEFIKS